MTEPDPANYPWWLASRSAGIVAFLLIATAVILGLLMASKMARRPGLKRNLVKVHEQVALTALVAIGAHGVLLLGDAWLKPGLTGSRSPSRSNTGPSGRGWESSPATWPCCSGRPSTGDAGSAPGAGARSTARPSSSSCSRSSTRWDPAPTAPAPGSG